MANMYAPPAMAPGPNWGALIVEALAQEAARKDARRTRRENRSADALSQLGQYFANTAIRDDTQAFQTEQAATQDAFLNAQREDSQQHAESMARLQDDLAYNRTADTMDLQIQKEQLQYDALTQRKLDKLKQDRARVNAMPWPDQVKQQALLQIDEQEMGLKLPENQIQPPKDEELVRQIPIYDETGKQSGVIPVDMNTGKMGSAFKFETPKAEKAQQRKPLTFQDIDKAKKQATEELQSKVDANNAKIEADYAAQVEAAKKAHEKSNEVPYWFDKKTPFVPPPEPTKVPDPTPAEINQYAQQLVRENQALLDEMEGGNALQPSSQPVPVSQPAGAAVSQPAMGMAPPAPMAQSMQAAAPPQSPPLTIDQKWMIARAEELMRKKQAGTITPQERAEAMALAARMRSEAGTPAPP